MTEKTEMPVLETNGEDAEITTRGIRRKYSEKDIARARSGSTPEALTIIDPYAARTRMRKLIDGLDVL